MKVLLINGSSHEKGCTFAALEQTAQALEEKGIETEIIFIGNQSMADCIACQKCRTLGKCVFDDIVNQVLEKCKTADGFVFGSPVYYAHPSGRLLSFMDRLFYAGGAHLAYKPAAAAVSARRAGTTAALDPILKHFTINNMPVVSSNYWAMVHGRLNAPEEVARDEEGVQIMRVLGYNMAWLLKCIEAGKEKGIVPQRVEKVMTNFIK